MPVRVLVPRATARLKGADSYTGPGMGRGPAAVAAGPTAGATRVCAGALCVKTAVASRLAATTRRAVLRRSTERWRLRTETSQRPGVCHHRVNTRRRHRRD